MPVARGLANLKRPQLSSTVAQPPRRYTLLHAEGEHKICLDCQHSVQCDRPPVPTMPLPPLTMQINSPAHSLLQIWMVTAQGRRPAVVPNWLVVGGIALLVGGTYLKTLHNVSRWVLASQGSGGHCVLFAYSWPGRVATARRCAHVCRSLPARSDDLERELEREIEAESRKQAKEVKASR